MLSVPLAEGGKPYGVMLLQLPAGMQLEDWKLKLLESIGHHIGAAFATAKRTDERRGIALLEERSVIARELHDSLAQSLTYLKIQVTRLKQQLNASGAREQTADVGRGTQAGDQQRLPPAARAAYHLPSAHRRARSVRGAAGDHTEFSQRPDLR